MPSASRVAETPFSLHRGWNGFRWQACSPICLLDKEAGAPFPECVVFPSVSNVAEYLRSTRPRGVRTEAQASRMDKECPYKLHVLRTTDDLMVWKDRWNELANRCGTNTFFSHHIFAEHCWQRHRGNSATRLHVIAVERAEELQLVMPLVQKREWTFLSTLRWLDSGTPLYCDALVDPEADVEALAAKVREHLLSVPFARLLKVGFVRPDTMLAQLMDSMGARSRSAPMSYGLDLAASSGWDDFLASRSSSSRQAYRRLFRRLGDHGRVRVEQICDPKHLEEEIAWIFATKRAWVLERYGGPNWLSPPETEAWFKSTAVRLSGNGQVFVLRLSCDQARVAAVLVYRFRSTLFASKIAYDPYWKRYSPGWLLNMDLIRVAFEQGIEHVDFMLGEDSWKTRLANRTCETRKYLLPLRLGLLSRNGRGSR